MQKNIYQLVFPCLLLVMINNLFAQEKLLSVDIFTKETDLYSIERIKTNTSDTLFLEEAWEEPSEYFNIIFIDNDIIYIDTVKAKPVFDTAKNDTGYFYYPVLRSEQMYYIKDTLFVAIGNAIITYTKQNKDNNNFVNDTIVYFQQRYTKPSFEEIIGYKNGKLILGNQSFDEDKSYKIAVYDIQQNKITKIESIYIGNGSVYSYSNWYNSFATNKDCISVMHPIEPKLYLYDYNLNLYDSIYFTINDDYKTTQYIIDTNISLNQSIVNPSMPKNILVLLDKINYLDYYSNVNHLFVNDTTILIITWLMKSDSCNILQLNTKTKETKIIMSFPKWDNLYATLTSSHNLELYSNGVFFDLETQLNEEDENIMFSLVKYYSSLLDFTSQTILLEDRKQNVKQITLTDYDRVVVFDNYLCKTCFVKDLETAKILFIHNDIGTDKISRLSWYKQLKKLYPNSEILFNHNNSFKKIKKNILLSPTDENILK